MTKIKSTEEYSKAVIVIDQNMPETYGNFDVCIELRDKDATLPGGSVVAAFTPKDVYEIIKALAKESGLLDEVGWINGELTVIQPKPVKSKEELRREELNITPHSDLLERIIELEKKTGVL